MDILRTLKTFFNKKSSDTAHDTLMQKIIELETLFSGGILENPDTIDVDAHGYKAACYARCKQYQENIAKRYAEIEKILTHDDGTVSPEKKQLIKNFFDEMLTCVRQSAEEFFSTLDEGDGQSEEVKREKNKQSYEYSVIKRKEFREQFKDLKNKL